MMSEAFTNYVLSFYGKGGIYEFDCDESNIRKACEYVSKSPKFEGDTFDREEVRCLLEHEGFMEVCHGN
tara:strand:+ start:353 stop:559 length:207 start_codon:yes stop_codon:yes gene_type:complete